ncbi:cytochrome P450 [Mycobacterium paraterrae]|uniref:Cytochrome P450 n=1 Tax=Mycobacterium paraterrae TaxID=577492 RepID=A0ABY3VLG3_9MYCO|nr:cytochrome P450 [Mycobacterium paraterrae]UMB69461.1 cytochrome P450 [Mycobacterium paraterrae]
MTAGADVRSINSLPRVGVRGLLGDRGRFFRPLGQQSPLRSIGERFLIDLPLGPKMVVTSSPDDAKAVFADRDGALSFGELMKRFSPHEKLFGSDAFIFLDGEAHMEEKRKVAPPLHGKALKSYEQAMTDIVLRRLPDWPLGERVEFCDIGGQLSLDVMMTVIFGVSKPERMRRLEKAMLAHCAATESPAFLGVGMITMAVRGNWVAIPSIARTAAAVDAIVLEEIAERRHSGARPDDCLTLFLEINQHDEHPRDDAFLARSMRGLMLAGYAATAVTLGWVAELLVHQPETLAALEDSIDRGEDAYLDAVIAESMRLRPALPITGRRALRDFDLNGLRIPRGAYIILAIMAMHERDDLHPDPLAFRPERFVNTRPGANTWLPFGGGVYRCVGAEFVLFEARVLLRTLLQHRRLSAVDSGPGGRPSRKHPLPVPTNGAPVVLSSHHRTGTPSRENVAI